jgi:hypothetical protein
MVELIYGNRVVGTRPINEEDLPRSIWRSDVPRLKGGEAAVLGKQLARLIFDTELEECLYRILDEAREARRGLRVRIETSLPIFAAVPWEFWYFDQLHGGFLVHQPDISLVHSSCTSYAASAAPDEAEKEEELAATWRGKLRILALFAQPRGFEGATAQNDATPDTVLQLHRELEVLFRALQKESALPSYDTDGKAIIEIDDSRFDLTVLIHKEELARLNVTVREGRGIHILDQPTRSELRVRLADCDILHFAGHGMATNQGGGLMLENENRGSDFYGAELLGTLLQGSDLRMVVLNGCKTVLPGPTAADGEDVQLTVAQAVVGAGVPVVVGMQTKISDHAAILFTQTVYGAIASDPIRPVDAAVAQARINLFHDTQSSSLNIDAPIWAVPVVFMGGDGQLWRNQIEIETHYVADEERQSISNTVQRLVAAARSSVCHNITISGPPGIGKATMLKKLGDEIRRNSDYRVAFIHQDDIFQMHADRNLSDVEADAMESFDTYKQLLRSLARDLARVWLTFEIDGAIESKNRMPNDSDAKNVTTTFQEGIRRVKRAAILLDGFSLDKNSKLTQWILNELTGVLNDLDGALLILTVKEPLTDSGKHFRDFQLKPFQQLTVQRYLEKRLQSNVSADLVNSLADFSGGHPLLVATAAGLLAKQALSFSELKAIMQTRTSSDVREVSDWLGEMIDYIKVPTVLHQQALEAVWVLRHFDAARLYFMLDVAEKDTVRLEPPLIDYLLQVPFTDKHENYFKIHELVRCEREDQLKKNQQERYKDLHRRAAAYYLKAAWCYEQNHKGNTLFSRWYRYEDSNWQQSMVEWLYHLSRVQDSLRARRDFALVYFEAFWWWGNYEPFDFCSELLTNWRQTRLASDDQQFGQLLWEFQTNYPTGYRKSDTAHQERWKKVYELLITIKENMLGFKASRIGNRKPIQEEDEPNLRAYLEIFLGNACQYGQSQGPDRLARAIRHYNRAYALVAVKRPVAHTEELNEDKWNMAWLSWHMADVYMEQGHEAEALRKVSAAFTLIADLDADEDEEDDRELKANVWRTYADLQWRVHNLEQAFTGYNYAVYNAYAALQTPRPLDPYTRTFFIEMRERLTDWLNLVWRNGRQEAVHALVGRLSAFWGGLGNTELIAMLLAADDKVRLQNLLLPPPPKPNHFGLITSTYYHQARSFVKSKEEYPNFAVSLLHALAEVHLAAHDSAQGLKNIDQAFIELASTQDGETVDRRMQANLWLTRARLFWQARNLEDTGMSYNNAVYQAYASQAILGPPTARTRDFYLNMRKQMARWLLSAWGSGQPIRIQSLLSEIGEFWRGSGADSSAAAALLSAGDLDGLQNLLFPPAPRDHHLGKASSPYHQQIRAFVASKESVH